MQSQLPCWVEILQALAVPAIAALGLYIAWRQWQTAHERVKLDLFDRRMTAYELLRKAVAPINASGKVKNVDTDNFARAMHEMRFLFDKGMESFVAGINKAVLDKYVLDEEMKDAPNRKQAIRKSSALFTKITNGIYTEMPERMEKFMRFRP